MTEKEDAPSSKRKRVEIKAEQLLGDAYDQIKEELARAPVPALAIPGAVAKIDINTLIASLGKMQEQTRGIGSTQRSINEFKTPEEKKKFVRDVAEKYFYNRHLAEGKEAA